MINADTSFLLGYRVPEDINHEKALRFYEARQDEIWLWSPWHRVEVFNALRQLTRHPDRKRRLRVMTAKALTNRIEQDVRIG